MNQNKLILESNGFQDFKFSPIKVNKNEVTGIQPLRNYYH